MCYYCGLSTVIYALDRRHQVRWRFLSSLVSMTAAFLQFLFQVDEIYHDESLGTNINIVLVRMIMVGYRQVSYATDCYRL